VGGLRMMPTTLGSECTQKRKSSIYSVHFITGLYFCLGLYEIEVPDHISDARL
jgi:hypothetical protein